jgi:hypothetical protein
MPEGGVDDGIRRGCSAAQTFQVLQIASMRLAPTASSDFAPASDRAIPRTWWPAPTSSFTTAEPMNPVAPVTNTRICASLI